MAVKGVILMDSRVKDVMTTDVVSVRETAEYKDIVAVLRGLHVSALPVLDEDGRLAGVVSEADLLLKEVGQEALGGYLISSGRRGERAKAAGVTAAELMTTPAVTTGPDDSLADAARLMHDRHVKRLPVVDQAGRLAGIVSRVDLLSVFDRPDSEIGAAVRKDIIARDFALDPDAFDVQVASGIVTITGQVETQAVARHLLEALRHAEGVVGVRSRLRFPPPDPSGGVARLPLRPPQHRMI
jgi:CBS-domain-containing membrane protein